MQFPLEWGAGQIFTANPQQSSRELLFAEIGEQEGKTSLPAVDGARADPVTAHLAI